MLIKRIFSGIVLILVLYGCNFASTPQSGFSTPLQIASSTSSVIASLTPTMTLSETTIPKTLSSSKIVFVSNRTGVTYLYKMDADGANQMKLVDLPIIRGQPSWSHDGKRIAFITGQGTIGNKIYLFNVDTAKLTALNDEFKSYIGIPVWSPDDRKIAFVITENEKPHIMLVNSDGTNMFRLTDGFEPVWSPNGRQIVFVSGQMLKGQGSRHVYRIDVDGKNILDLTSSIEDLTFSPIWVAERNRILFLVDKVNTSSFYEVGIDGSGLMEISKGLNVSTNLALLSGGKQIAFCLAGKDRGLYRMNIDGTNLTRIIRDPVNCYSLAWSTNDQMIVFQGIILSSNHSGAEIYIVQFDGTGLRRLTNNISQDMFPTWQP